MSLTQKSTRITILVALCSLAIVNALPNPQGLVDAEFTTELGPLRTTSESTPSTSTSATTSAGPSTTTTDRSSNPVFNVWEYAYVHDGPIDTRNSEPEPQVAAQEEDNSGNQCLWAIVSCCNAHTNYERDNCFDALGCPGAWFQNLCSEEYINAANNQVTSIFSGGFGKK